MTNEGVHEIGAMGNKNMLWRSLMGKAERRRRHRRKYCRNNSPFVISDTDNSPVFFLDPESYVHQPKQCGLLYYIVMLFTQIV